MTLLQYVQSLQDQGATDISAKVEEWKKNNPTPVEVEPVVEEKPNKFVKNEEGDVSFNLDSFKTDETKKIAENINKQNKVKGNAAANQDTTASATPEVSESLYSGSGESLFQESDYIKNYKKRQQYYKDYDENQAKYEEQQAKLNTVTTKGKTHTANTFDYKWELNDEGGIDYYQKKEGKEEWKKEEDNLAIYSIAGELGHLSEEEEKKLQNFKNQQPEKVDPFAWAKNADGEMKDLLDTSGVEALGELPGISTLSGFELGLEDPKTDKEILDNQNSNSDKALTKAKKDLEEKEAAYDDALTPEVRERLEEQADLLGNYEVAKAKLEKKLDSIPMGSTDYEVVEKELSELDSNFSIANQAYLNTSQPFIDKRLEEQMPDIEQKAAEAAMIDEVEEPTLWNLAGKVFQNAKGPSGLGNVVSKITGDIFNPEDKDLIKQQDLYAAEKARYAKENNVSLKDVTNEMVRPAVEAAYVDIFSLQARKDAYENYSDSLLSDPDVPIFDLFKKLTGFKSLTDVFGDTEQEINADVAARGFSFDTAKTNLVYEQAKNEILKIDSQLLALTETKFISEDSAVEARGQFEKLVKQRQQNIDIANDTLNSLGEKVKTSKDVGLYSNMIAKNYGAGSGLGGFIISASASLIAGGLEGAERYGLTRLINPLSRLPMTNEMREAYFGEGGLFDSRKLTNIQISMLDAVQESIEGEMAEAKDWDNSEGLMQKSRWMARTAGQQIPIYALLYGTGGAGLGFIGLSTAGSKFREMQNEIDFNGADYTKWQMYTAATMTGASAVASEYVTQGMLGRLGVSFKADKLFANGFKETMSNLVKGGGRWLVDQSEEVGSEVADNIVGNIVDKYVLQKKGVNIFDNVKETAFSTLFTSGIVMRLPTIGASITAPFRSKQSFQKIGENTRTIKDLSKQLESETLSDKGREVIETQIEKLVIENMDALKTDLSRIDDMSDAEKKSLMESKAAEYENLRAIEDVNNDVTLDRSTKETLIKDLRKQAYEHITERYKVLAPYITAENKAKNMAAVESDIAVVEKLAGKENVTVIETAEEFAKQTGQDKYVDAYIDSDTGQIFVNKEWAATVGATTAASHELLHKVLKSTFDRNPTAAIKMVEDFKNVLSSKELAVVQERIDANYRYELNEDGSFVLDDKGNKIENAFEDYAEEYLNVFYDALNGPNPQITWSDNKSESFLRLGGKIINFFKGEGFTNMEFESGREVYNFLKDYKNNIKDGKLSEKARKLMTEGEVVSNRDQGDAVTGREVKKSVTKPNISPRGVELTGLVKEGLITNEGLIDIINSPSSTAVDKFGAIDAVVESNWPVISKGLKFNPTGTIPMADVKTAVTEQMQGIFPGRNKPLMADFNAETAQVNTYLGSLMGVRQAEILQRASEIAATSTDSTSIDSDQAKQVVDTSTTTSKSDTSRSDKVAKKPTETTQYSDTNLENLGVETQEQLELQTTEAVQDSFKDSEVTRFGETRNIPQAVADIYGKMFGINPQTIVDKTRNYQNYDAAGLTAAKQFLLKNAANDFSRLPKTKDGFGKGTFLPRNVMAALYTDGVLTGNLKDYINLLRQKPTKPIYRDALGQTIRGLLNLNIRNRMFETLVPTTPKRLQGGAKFSVTSRFAVTGENGKTVMRDLGRSFAKANKIKIEVDGELLTVDNLNYKNPAAVKYLKDKIENDLWKFIPLESLTRGTMVDYSSKGDRSFYFDKNSYDKIYDNAKKNRDAWLKEGNELSYDIKEVNAAKASKNPAKNTKRYLEEFSKAAQEKILKNNRGIKSILDGGVNAIENNPQNYLALFAIYSTQADSTSHTVRNMAVDAGLTMAYALETGKGKTVKEHVEPANEMAPLMFEAQLRNEVDILMPVIDKVYYQLGITKLQDGKLSDTNGEFGDSYNYIATQVEFFQEGLREYFKTGDVSKIPSPLVRYFNPQVNKNFSGDGLPGFNSNEMVVMGKTVAEEFTRQLSKSEQNPNSLSVQNDLTYKVLTGEITQAKAVKELNKSLPIAKAKIKPSITNNNLQPNNLKFDESSAENSEMIVNELNKLDNALANGRKLNQPVKKIRIFDFDDTLATSKSMVIVNMADGTSKKINATEFALQAADLEAQGAQFDFAEFSKVVDGKKGPLFDVAKKIADARGTEDLFILTARPQSAAGPIKAFMNALGVNIPLKNITGLSDGTAAAKGRWVAGKAAEGYNDFYFADDAVKNVKAVKDVLSQIDVKSKVQQAKFSKTQTFDTIVNDMIEDSSGIEYYKEYSAARAKTIGANKGKFNFFIPPSAEDFTGLLYKMLGKGDKGDAQMAFLKANLLDTYDRAESAVTQAKIAAANDFKALKNKLTTLPNSLSKPTGIGGFTFSHAVRTAIWTAQGMDIPGLSKRDIKELNNFVENNAELKVFANELIKIQKGKPYPKPGKSWLGGNITSDIINDINKTNRAEYQQEWRENVDIIFSEANMNKMEAAYGTRWREAMEDSLRRMKSGSNRPVGGNKTTDALLDWLNNSVGAVMFLNTRSAVLQTISAVNFLNWGDNNVIKAAAAFANQKQYWSDFNTLMNSDYLVERRNGLKINVSESEIQDAVRDSTNKSKAIIALILSKGFVFTRFADSFAIATGGATFFRNRVNALIDKGMDQKAAEAQAFEDFRQIAEESQQSSNPNKISAQQASGAGRVILAWANTPMQYARIQKRAAQDLLNGRGDWKTNVSKIAYYGVVQNLIFNALQQALFAIAFDDDDEEKEADSIKAEERYIKVANGMVDSQLKGLGIMGSATVALKNTLMTLYEEHGKKSPKYENAIDDLLSFSPPLGSKIGKIKGGLRSFSWNMKDMKEKGFSLDNPAYLAGAQIITGFTNVPLDRLMKKVNNLRGMMHDESALWQKVALGLGWSTWNLGLGYYGGFDAAKVLTPEEELTKEVTDMKKLTKTKEQVDMLLDFGLTKKEIKALGKEEARVRKILELMPKNK